MDGLTVARIRGRVQATLLTATASGDGFEGAIGIGITTNEALTAGAASCPSPQTDPDWEGWMWHNFFSLRVPTLSGVYVQHSVDLDVRAKRKLDIGYAIFAVLEVIETGTSTMLWYVDSRALVLLP